MVAEIPTPYLVLQPTAPVPVSRIPIKSGCEVQQGLHPREIKCLRRHRHGTPKGPVDKLAHKLTCSELQPRGKAQKVQRTHREELN